MNTDLNKSTHIFCFHRRPGAGHSLRAILSMITLLVVVPSACSGKQYAEETDEAVEMPDAYMHTDVDGEELDRWCSDFDAPTLEQLVDRAFERNLDLKSSWARLKQADASARQAGAARWPMINTEGSAQRTERPSLPEDIGFENNQLKASVGASYEIDLWGKLADRHKAAQYDVRAARADVEAMAMSLTTQIAENWFNLVHQRAKADLLERQMETSNEFLDITLLRLSRGSANALDVNQQRQQIESLEGQLEQIRARQQTAKHQLSVLVGKPPQTDVTEDRSDLPDMPPRPDAGVPADLLQNRPDIRAAMLRLEAADKRTAAAVKDQFPSISLSTSLFTQAPNLDELFEEFFWQAIASATQPLFDGGRRFAEIDRAEAAAEAQLYQYAQNVLQALREVEDAMILENRQTDFIESLREQHETAQQALDLARQRYQRGAADYLRVLNALQSMQSIEQSLLDARRQQLSNRLQLCRSLGGSWTRDLEPPNADSSDSTDSSAPADSSDPS